MTVRSYVDDVIRIEQLRLEAEALGLTVEQIDHLEIVAERLGLSTGQRTAPALEALVRMVHVEVAHDRLRFGPMLDLDPSERARLALRRLAYAVWISPCERVLGWLQRRIDRSPWGQP